MFTKTKSLNEHINEFLDKLGERESKINEIIRGLTQQADAMNAKLKEQSSAMVEYDLSGDSKGADQCRKRNKEIRAELLEIEDAIQNYKNQLEKSSPFHAKELLKIREAALKAKQDRLDRRKEVSKQLEDLKRQLEELESKKKQMSFDLSILTTEREVIDLKRILKYIDPRTTRPTRYFETESFVKAWMNEEDTERYFA